MKLRRTLIDNNTDPSKGYHMTEVLKECLEDTSIKEAYIATGYWDLRGTELLYEELQKFLARDGSKLRILIGKDPLIYKGDAQITKGGSYDHQEQALRVDLDDLSVSEKYVKVVKMLVDNVKDKENDKFQIHVYKPECREEEQFLHSKCYIFKGEDEENRAVAYGIIGSSNFTQKGLEGNSELNILEIEPNNITNENPGNPKDRTHLMWFNEKWEDSKPWEEQFLLLVNQSKMWDAIQSTQAAKRPHEQEDNLTPYELYIKLLQVKFGIYIDKNLDEVIESYLPRTYDRYDYQIDAVKQCLSTMKEHGGFMLADVVGLGKTIVGSLIIKHFLQFPDDDERERKVLIITPPAIQSAWKDTINEFDKDATDKMADYIDFITTGSIAKLTDGTESEDTDDDNYDSGDFEEELKHENYGLIIIDESHKFRNSGTSMYKALDDLIAEIGNDTGNYPYIGLLSATPQNNRPDDLKNQIYLFERSHNETSLTKANSGNLENFFAEINSEYTDIIHPDEDDTTTQEERNEHLKEISKRIRDCVLTDIMVRRTRTDVQKYYSEDMKRQNLKFPQIKGPVSLNYSMDKELSQLFADTMDYISPSEEYKLHSDKYLSYYRYRAIQYLVDENIKKKYDARGSRDADKLADQLANIMMINLVKRLESSFSAFYQSLLNLRQYTLNMIDMWNNGNIFICPQINVNEELDIKAKEEKRNKKVTFGNCVDDIREKIRKLNEDGRNENERNSEYTINDFKKEYIDLLKHDYDILCELCDRWAKNTEDPKLDVFKENLKSVLFNKETNIPQKLVIFSEAIDTVETIRRVAENKGYKVLMVTAANRDVMEPIIRENFDANYGKKPGEIQKNNYDVIVTTEVLAEGINLHRANVILNYDTPWNSTRLMQRIGRVNRIGSTQDYVYVYNFKPSAEGDAEIQLVQKAYTKLQSFHTLFGEDSKVYTEDEEVSHYDLNTIVNGEESPLEKYIYELKKYRDENPERYEYILNKEDGLEMATTFVDGCSYFHVKSSRMTGLYVKVDPANNKGKIISSSEMYQNFAVSPDAVTKQLPADWDEQKAKAEKAVNQFLNRKYIRRANSNNATKAKEILRKMKKDITMSEKSKSLLNDAFSLVNKGNNDIIKKILAFDSYMNTAQNDLFGGLTQQDFDDMIEREISNVVSQLQHKYGKANVFIGLSK